MLFSRSEKIESREKKAVLPSDCLASIEGPRKTVKPAQVRKMYEV